MDLADVPNFSAMPGVWYRETEKWLLAKGWGVVVIYPKDEKYPWWASNGLLALGHGKSPRGEWWHSVIYRVAEDGLFLAHDPHPAQGGLDGSPEELWFLVPAPEQIA
jgi:hypothetical protein